METNTLIIEKFNKLVDIRNQELNDYKKNGLDKKYISQLSFKLKNYKLGLEILQNHPNPILNPYQLKTYKGVGTGIIKRIEEILETKKLLEVDEYNSQEHQDFIKQHQSPNIKEINESKRLQDINGIGPSKAEKLLKEDYNLDRLLKEWEEIKGDETMIKSHPIIGKLTHSQLIGIKYFQDISERIPREEIIEMRQLLSDTITEIDSNICWEICGSFRRGSPDSGDIDILISRKDLLEKEDVEKSGILKKLVEVLTRKGILIDDLTKKGDTKYMGIGKLPNVNKGRRIDIRCVAFHSYIPALLYFTGSMEENVRLRNIAIYKKYKINEYGFYKLESNQEKPIILEKEEDLYHYLEQSYKLPTER